MKKSLLLAVIVASVFSGCQLPDRDLEPLTLRLDQIIFENLEGDDARLAFDFYIDRNDLGLKEPDNSEGVLVTSDLPKKLRPDKIEVIYGDFSENCEVAFFPHRCELNYTEERDEYDLEISYGERVFKKKIEVEAQDPLEVPVISFPEKAPRQGDLAKISFKDVGAQDYEVQINMCHPYGDDGINPCLDEVSYNLSHDGEGLVLEQSEEANLEGDGEMVTITSKDSPLFFEESVQYRVQANYSGLNEDGVKIILRASAFAEFGK